MKLEALTPRDDLHGKEDSFKVYKDYLDDAFDNPKIRNLALSGSLGSGKSSIIRSYDRARNYGKKHFLYVSLMSFSNQSSEPPTDDQKQLEYSLLNQIMSCCTSKDLPEGSINGIPEKFKWLQTCSLWLSALCLSIYMLIFHSQFGKLAAKLAEKTLFGFDLSRYLSEDIRTWVHLGLYAFVGIILFICVFCILRRCLPFFRLSKLTVKANNAEAEVLMGKERTSLDVYKFELAYALEKIGKNYNYTVVFEDLERLDPGVAVDIMEKLRELNTLTNNHIQATRINRVLKFLRGGCYKESLYYQDGSALKKRCEARTQFIDKLLARKLIRFIYPISEQTIKQEYRAKFYDCIIPIIPISNPLNSKEKLRTMLTKLDIPASYHQQLLDALNVAIVDCRTQLTLKNEFSVLWDLATPNNAEDNVNKVTMFAIAAYKILLPQCFEYALSPNGTHILPTTDSPKFKEYLEKFIEKDQQEDVSKAIQSLQNDLLDEYSLRLIVGEQQLIEHWLKFIQIKLAIDNPTDDEMEQAHNVILAVEKNKEKLVSSELLEDFRNNMIKRLHTLHSIEAEKHFMLVAQSLAVLSRSDVAEDWGWLMGNPSKEYLRNCIKFLSVSHIKPSVMPKKSDTSFSDWCITSTKLYGNKEMCINTGWDDNMANLLADYLSQDDPLFCDNHEVLAVYQINGRAISSIINPLDFSKP